MKKNLLIGLILMIACEYSAQSKFRKFNPNEAYFRVAAESQYAQFRNPTNNSKGISLWFETPFDNKKFSAIWTLGAFKNQNRAQFHFPGGAAVLIGVAAILGPVSGTDCFNNMSDETAELLVRILALPEGVGWTPIRKKKVNVGFYCNVLSLDVMSGQQGLFDYLPETGLKANFYPYKRSLVSIRLGGKYSVSSRDYCAFANLSFGYDFKIN